jgi:hypothetical protein
VPCNGEAPCRPRASDHWDRRLRQRRQARLAGDRRFDRRRQLATLPLGIGRLALGEFRHDLGGKRFDRFADVLVTGTCCTKMTCSMPAFS